MNSPSDFLKIAKPSDFKGYLEWRKDNPRIAKRSALCQRLVRPSIRPLGTRYQGVSTRAAAGGDRRLNILGEGYRHTPGGLSRKAIALIQAHRIPRLRSTYAWTPTACRPCSEPHAVWWEEETVSVL